MTYTQKQQGGFANLMGIMIVTIIGIAAALSLLTLDSTALDRTLTEDAAITARTNADVCSELALLQLRGNSAYVGVDSRVLSRGACTATTTNAINGDGNHAANIIATGSVDDVAQTQEMTLIVIDATSSPSTFTDLTYQEIATP